jgi:hypothetical protein
MLRMSLWKKSQGNKNVIREKTQSLTKQRKHNVATNVSLIMGDF